MHAQRRKDVLLHEGFITLPADLLDQITEQHVPGVTVVPLLARLEIECFVEISRDQFLRRGWKRLGLAVIGKARETRDTGSVREEMEDGDLVPCSGRIRHVLL